MMAKVFKDDLIAEYAELREITKVEAGRRIDDVLELIGGHLEAGDDVKISGFFNFFIRERKAKDAKNPKTGEGMTIEATKTCVAKMTKPLKRRVQGVEE